MCRDNCHGDDDNDQEEVALQVAIADAGQKSVGDQADACSWAVSASCVKMKLNTLLRDRARGKLNSELNNMVMVANRVVGEAYAFANFHITRCFDSLSAGKFAEIKVDRNYFYRCLLAVSTNNARQDTLGVAFQSSIREFDACRPAGQVKVDVRDLNPLIADLSISMAAMASNHLWMNLNARIARFVKWRFPALKGWWSRIVAAVSEKRKVNLDVLFPNDQVSPRATAAKAAAADLRNLLPETIHGRFATRAHQTIPLYHHILKTTEEEIQCRRCLDQGPSSSACQKQKRGRLRTFTMLPIKRGFTLAYIPISKMTWIQLLKRVKLEPGVKGDGRTANHRCMWAKYCNLSAIETATRKFDGQIVTDGYGVSVLMTGHSAPRCPVEPMSSVPDLAPDALEVGVDPGMDDFVTVADNRGRTWRCSSGEFWEHSGAASSAHWTRRWNRQTVDVASSLPSPHTVGAESQKAYLRAYLAALPGLLEHRRHQGYRKMRFMRFCRRKAAISWLCSRLAPPSEGCVVVGFGDWSGGNQSPISRRSTAPLQDIKFELQKRPNVVLGHIRETLTSQVCHCCRQRLCNMKADTVVIKRRVGSDGMVSKERTVRHGRIHKVLHCKNSDVRSQGRCGTTWNRDVNAAKNILMLTTLVVRGQARPWEFTSANFRLYGLAQQGEQGNPEPRQTAVTSPSPNRGYRTL